MEQKRIKKKEETMARKKQTDRSTHRPMRRLTSSTRGEVIEQQITDTLEKNYMPYAMSVIVSRAIPEIDGFKPSHRKLLYTMYKMGLLDRLAHQIRQRGRDDDEAQPPRRDGDL